jgi:hypothetical protein
MRTILPVMLISCFVFLSLGSAVRESLTYDENVHIQIGMDAWKTQTFTKDPFSPPLIGEIAAIPKIMGFDRLISSPIPSTKALPSRVMILILSVGVLIAIYVSVKRMIGEPEAITAAFLFVWEPTILAHSHYVTKDMGFTFFFFLAYIFFLSLIKKFSWKIYVFFIVSFGFMLASKASAMPFFVVSLCILFLLQRSYATAFVKLWKKLLVGICLSFFVVWICYFFQTDVIIAKRDDPGRISSRLLKYAKETNNTVLTKILLVGTRVRIPLGTYLGTMKNAILLQREKGQIFFLGKEYAEVRWYFLPVNFFLKLPIPLVIFYVMTFYWLYRKKIKATKLIPYIAPIIGIFVFLSVSGVKPYARYLLPVYPFLIVISAVGLTGMIKKNVLIISIILCVWYTIGTLLYFPHFVSFANAFAGIRDKRYEKLIDSDIDWGQGLFDVAGYVRKNTISTLSFSYFGTDDGNYYGLPSATPYGTYKKEEICAFHDITGPSATIESGSESGKMMTAISLSNWYYCGYNKTNAYSKEKIIGFIGDTTLLFNAPRLSL